MHITQNFDGGNIVVLSADKPESIRLEIRKDNKSDFFQWFYFRLSGVQDQACIMSIENARDAAFEGGWENYQVRASYDREDWFLVPTRYEDGKLIIEHTPEYGSVYYAYYAPYSMERHADLIAQTQMHDDVRASVLGQTLDGQDMDVLTIGQTAGKAGEGKKQMWVFARQHPGETMAEWWIEGFLSRLLDDDDPTARVLREKCVFHVVPNMNPDGSKRGHLRTNACGANLNREWGVATLERSPEVLLVMDAMAKTGVDFCLDVHGDEALPYNFIAGAEGVAGFTDKDQALLDDFQDAYTRFSPDFQTKVGYGTTPAGKANLTMATNYIAEVYSCLSMTLEMPFKDNADLPDPDYGWSAERSIRLGADVLGAMLSVVDDL
ncbi:MAG: hypothetical protein JKY25_03345 [Robiginitomaculum sp.]|nr:hypothetical protein [Robiginitomaculum sp.]